MQDFQKLRMHRYMRTADSYWAACVLTYTLGMFNPAMAMLRQTVEMFLTAVMLKYGSYSSTEDMERAIRKFHKSGPWHDIGAMYVAVCELSTQNGDHFREHMGGKSLSWIDDSVTKYGEGSAAFNDKLFVMSSSFVKAIRAFLDMPRLASDYALIRNNISMPRHAMYSPAEAGLKAILSVRNKKSRKDLIKWLSRRLHSGEGTLE